MLKQSHRKFCYFAAMWYIINTLQYLLFALWTIVSILVAMFFMIFFGSPPAMWMARNLWAPVLILIAGSRITVKGRENLDITQPSIYVANHESQMDIAAMFYSIPVPIYFIAKKELKKLPFIGWFISAIGMIFVDRKNRDKARQSLQEAGKLIKGGKNVIAFAEGTRSLDGKVKMFKRGSFIIAQEAQVPVVPVAIDGTLEIWPAKKLYMRPGRIQVVFGKPIMPEVHKDLPVEEFAEMARAQIVALKEQP